MHYYVIKCSIAISRTYKQFFCTCITCKSEGLEFFNLGGIRLIHRNRCRRIFCPLPRKKICPPPPPPPPPGRFSFSVRAPSLGSIVSLFGTFQILKLRLLLLNCTRKYHIAISEVPCKVCCKEGNKSLKDHLKWED